MLRLPLMRTGRALGQFPFVAEQVPEEVVAPLRWRRGPDDFQAAGDRVPSFARAKFALPAEALLLDAGGFRLRPHQRRIAGAVGFAEGVTAGNQRDRFFVVHRHPAERFTNVPGRRERIGIAVRSFRIHVDQTHLHGAQRILDYGIQVEALELHGVVECRAHRIG